jgi:hypothetical protein
MSENHKTEWESLRNGERTEIGLVQVDIEGHSKIKANDRNLKKAKDIFSDEIERIAVAHGGKLFKWEGDGGSYMFLMRDGENFNRLVKAALVMLESMPAINKKIADETDLKDSIRVRLSCDSGIAEFDNNPTRIAADFINNFIKNERKISLADNVCITECVYTQLDSQLRARFSLYKHSPEIRGDLYCLPRPKSPLQWKHVVLLLLLGMVLGLVCAAILAKNGWWVKPETNHIVFTGSGTVYLYLTKIDPDIFKNLSNETGIDVLALQAPTDIGGSQFAHVFDQKNTLVLVMASKRLKHEVLSRPEPGRSEGKEARRPKAVFEVYLGEDPLEMLLVAKNNSTVEKDFEGIPWKDSVSKDPREGILAFAELDQIGKWTNGEYNVYVGMDGSATKAVWDERLRGKDNKRRGLPPNPETWDIQNTSSINLLSKDPNIFLGSKALMDATIAKGINNPIKKLTMLRDESNEPATRSLYLYGFLYDREKRITDHGGEDGYDLPEHVTKILKYVFEKLAGSTLNKDCLQQQKDYFHLNGKWAVGWVKVESEDTAIYRVGTCTERPEE